MLPNRSLVKTETLDVAEQTQTILPTYIEFETGNLRYVTFTSEYYVILEQSSEDRVVNLQDGEVKRRKSCGKWRIASWIERIDRQPIEKRNGKRERETKRRKRRIVKVEKRGTEERGRYSLRCAA